MPGRRGYARRMVPGPTGRRGTGRTAFHLVVGLLLGWVAVVGGGRGGASVGPAEAHEAGTRRAATHVSLGTPTQVVEAHAIHLAAAPDGRWATGEGDRVVIWRGDQ